MAERFSIKSMADWASLRMTIVWPRMVMELIGPVQSLLVAEYGGRLVKRQQARWDG